MSMHRKKRWMSFHHVYSSVANGPAAIRQPHNPPMQWTEPAVKLLVDKEKGSLQIIVDLRSPSSNEKRPPSPSRHAAGGRDRGEGFLSRLTCVCRAAGGYVTPIIVLSITCLFLALISMVLAGWNLPSHRRNRQPKPGGPASHPISSSGYNDADPWHSCINLVFMLNCDHCRAVAELDWDKIEDGDDSFLRECVALADTAKAAGWTYLGNYRFLCPRCALATAEQGPHPADR
jgi:hypothetical protein